MIASKKAGIMESKLVQALMILVFIVAAIVLYLAVRDSFASNLKNTFSFF